MHAASDSTAPGAGVSRCSRKRGISWRSEGIPKEDDMNLAVAARLKALQDLRKIGRAHV